MKLPSQSKKHLGPLIEGWGDPQETELTIQCKRARALKWMDSISGLITFSLTYFQDDHQPLTDQTKVKSQSSDWVHISMQVEAPNTRNNVF